MTQSVDPEIKKHFDLWAKQNAVVVERAIKQLVEALEELKAKEKGRSTIKETQP